MFDNLNIPSFGELYRKYVLNFRNRLEILLFGEYFCLIIHFSLTYAIGGVTAYHHS